MVILALNDSDEERKVGIYYWESGANYGKTRIKSTAAKGNITES